MLPQITHNTLRKPQCHVSQEEQKSSVTAMCGADLPHCEVHSCVVTLHGAYLAVLQSVALSLWRVSCQQWELMVLRVGLKRVKWHVQNRSNPKFDLEAVQHHTILAKSLAITHKYM